MLQAVSAALVKLREKSSFEKGQDFSQLMKLTVFSVRKPV